MVDKKKPAPGSPNAAPTPPKADDDEETPDDDEIVEDFEIRFAKELVNTVSASTRPKLVAGASKLVTKVRADEERKLVAALSTIGVDWSGAPAQTENPALDVAIATAPGGTLKAGDVVSVTATVKNTGAGAAWRVLPRLHADDGVFEDTELPIGKVGPGETKTFTTKLKVPDDALDRVDHLSVEVREARNQTAHVTPADLHVEALPRPVFAYAYQLVDDGNGDGLVQRGEKYRLQVQVKNTGAGPTKEATVFLRNASGDGVVLDKSRAELKDPLQPGQVKEIEFPLATEATLKGDELVVELTAYDAKLDVSTTEKLRFKVSSSVQPVPARGEVTTRAMMPIRSGAADYTSAIGTAQKGASYAAIASYGPYTKVKLNAGGSKVGFLPTSLLTSGGSGTGSFTQGWNSVPPMISLNTKGLETHAETYRLAGSITDEQHVEDVYVFVSNQSAKIEQRKVFYRSNRGGKDGKLLDFATDLPLWPGSNMVTVVARSNAEVRSVKTMFVYREPPRTAQAKP
jgi:carboxyl-terminal processing protease